MPIETILLIIESILLIFTIVLLLYSIREGKERKNMLLELGRTTKILTRQEYFLTVKDSMMDAKAGVFARITGRLPSGDDTKRTKEIVDNIARLTSGGVKVRYLLPKFPDRLHIGHEYAKAGAEVHFSGCLVGLDIRYTVIDGRLVIIGIPESVGEKEATKKGYKIPSEGLATILKEDFEGCLSGAVSYEDYVREIVKDTGASARLLAHELHIDEAEITRLSGRP